mmetsp:Transcript_54522/g.119372  ORF Transcript_54522/g.119372 Transcript_54522/m.119372 type:complete len:240 (+) Transcript_54522:820-1539(+)
MIEQQLVDMLILSLFDLVNFHLAAEFQIDLELFHLLLVLSLQLLVVLLKGVAKVLQALCKALDEHLDLALIFQLRFSDVTLQVQLLLVHLEKLLRVHLALFLKVVVPCVVHLSFRLLVLILQVLDLLFMNLDVDPEVSFQDLHLPVHVEKLSFDLFHLRLGDLIEPVHHVFFQLHVVSIFGRLAEAVLKRIDPIFDIWNGELLEIGVDFDFRLCSCFFVLSFLWHGACRSGALRITGPS